MFKYIEAVVDEEAGLFKTKIWLTWFEEKQETLKDRSNLADYENITVVGISNRKFTWRTGDSKGLENFNSNNLLVCFENKKFQA